ncbi:MAG: EI24 domain-containing protein [Myxococcales bacterium]|nr:EI24 domain-containing protein [Myxococcales bacterium]MDH3844470.1 EI24 domain-containing protein [Myxococcales bacterium]
MKRVIEGAGAVAKSPVGFARGLSYAFQGVRFVYFQHPSLVRYWLFPILITAVALFGVFYGAGSYYDALGDALWSWLPDSWGQATGWVGALLAALRWVIDLLLGLLLAVLGLVLVVILSSIVAAPFNDALSEAVEHILTGEPAPPFSFKRMVADIVRTVRLELLKVLIYVAVVGPLFLASFLVPGIGQIISLVGFALTAIYLGVDYVDWPAARRDWSVADRVGFVRRRLAAVAGFGTGVWVLLFVPLVNLFFMPAAVAGGTMLFIASTPPRTEKRGQSPFREG